MHRIVCHLWFRLWHRVVFYSPAPQIHTMNIQFSGRVVPKSLEGWKGHSQVTGKLEGSFPSHWKAGRVIPRSKHHLGQHGYPCNLPRVCISHKAVRGYRCLDFLLGANWVMVTYVVTGILIPKHPLVSDLMVDLHRQVSIRIWSHAGRTQHRKTCLRPSVTRRIKPLVSAKLVIYVRFIVLWTAN